LSAQAPDPRRVPPPLKLVGDKESAFSGKGEVPMSRRALAYINLKTDLYKVLDSEQHLQSSGDKERKCLY
jgi:hypothetical protein